MQIRRLRSPRLASLGMTSDPFAALDESTGETPVPTQS
jgi:hypothetical protein